MKFLSSTIKTSLNKYILIFQPGDMLNFWLNFNYSEPIHAFKHYAYKKEYIVIGRGFQMKNK